MDEDNFVTEMALPTTCPHCDRNIIFKIHQPYPLVEVLTPDQLPDEIKDAIINSHDSSQEPEAK